MDAEFNINFQVADLATIHESYQFLYKKYVAEGDKGGFQLEFASIRWVINHMTCCRFECSHWWKIYF